jgi:dihydrofolate reductase
LTFLPMYIPRLSMIVAVDESRAIGKNNRLLWNIKEDLKHFKDLTTGHVIIMGENTYHSIGRPLPNRTMVVVTLNQDLELPGCFVAHSLEEALAVARREEKEEIFVVGGASIYKQFLPMIERLYLTLVSGKHEADTYFPDYSDFKKIISEDQCDNGEYQFTFFVLEKS